MNIEEFRTYCLQKDFVTEAFPFGPETLVFKVAEKVFALAGLDEPDLKVNLKCDPAYALKLREEHAEILPGWHMNKKHWNTVAFTGSLSDALLKELIDHSYELVLNGLPRSVKKSLGII